MFAAVSLVSGQVQTACQNVPHNSFVANPASCSHYYVCASGVAHSRTCDPQWRFNPLNQMCDHPHLVDCQQCSPFGIQMLPNPNTCSGFIRCQHGQRTYAQCPQGQLFDRSTGACNYSNLVHCNIPAPPPTNPGGSDHLNSPYCQKGELFYAHATNCNHYFRCYGTALWEFACPSNLHWNRRTNGCDHPAWAQCTATGGTQPPVIIPPPAAPLPPNNPGDIPIHEIIPGSTIV